MGFMIKKKLNNMALSIFCLLQVLGWSNFSIASVQEGKSIFAQKCFACHSVGGGRKIGPDLLGVEDRRDLNWIKKFINSPQEMINGGDAQAKALFDEYKILMPPQGLSDQEMLSVLEYIKSEGSSSANNNNNQTAEQPPAEEEKIATTEDIERGLDLFQGKIRFKNGGAACNSCHHVKNDAVIGGGVLARELTSVFSKIGGSAVSSILGSPPFPVMNQAYEDKPLTEPEIFALISFLKNADEEQAYQQPRDYGWRLLWSGVFGVVLLFGGYSIVFRKRKKTSVNQEIYDRQIKSEWEG